MSFYDTPYDVRFSEPEKTLNPFERNTTARLGINPNANLYDGQQFYQDPEGNWYTDANQISVNVWQAMMGQAPKESQDVYNQYGEGVTRYTPYLSREDYLSDPNLEYVNILDPESARELIDLKNTDPKAYANRMASFLGDVAFSGWAQNRNVSDVLNRLEAYKETDPKAYYSAYIALKGKQMGWDSGNGAGNRNAPMQQEIQSIANDAIKSGLTPTDINSIIGTNFGDYSNIAARTNAVNAASGGGGFNFGTDMLPGLKIIGGALLGAGTADYLATGAEAANGASNVADITSSTGFTPVDGASFAIDPNVAYTTGVTTPLPADIGMGTNAPLQGPTYGELGVTGVPEGGMGPTYAEMGNTGLNTQEAIAAADAASQKAALVDALKTANQVRQVGSTANTLAKLLTSSAGSQLSGAAQNLATGQTGVGSAIPALIRGNQNPFLQTAQQPIRSTSPDLASLANLLKQG
jgi:hypothetical protein